MYTELAKYLGIPEHECIKRFQDIDVRSEWDRRAGDVAFYADTDFYLYDLTHFEHSACKKEYGEEILRFADKAGCKVGMDYGCGIGTDVIKLLHNGFDMVYAVDVDGPHVAYMWWRLTQRGLQDRVLHIPIDADTGLPSDTLPRVDMCVCIAVLEHVKDPFTALRLISDSAQYVALKIDPTNPGGQHPMHYEENFVELAKLENGNRAELAKYGLTRVNDTNPPIYKTSRR